MSEIRSSFNSRYHIKTSSSREFLMANIKSICMVLAVGVFAGGPISIVVGGLISSADKERSMSAWVQNQVAETAAREKEIYATFDALDAMTNQACSESHLDRARSKILTSDVIEDILYKGNGSLACSAIVPRSDLSFAFMDVPGFSLGPGITVWRNVQLPYAKGRTFLIIRRNTYFFVLHPINYPADSGGTGVTVSRWYIDRQNNSSWNFQGLSYSIPLNEIRNGRSFWRAGTFITVACNSDEISCLGLSAPWQVILRAKAYPFGLLAAAGALIGSSVSAIFMLWRYKNRSVVGRLRRALKRDELSLVYQPIVDSKTGKLVSAEALMRWFTPNGAISPDLFIPLAEDGEFIGDLTRWAIHKIGRDLGEALCLSPEFRISINIVSQDLTDPDFHDALQRNFWDRGIAPRQIALELTERRAAQVEAAIEILQELRSRGCLIYIDDFGTGYSNICYLSDFSIDAIKLDKSFTGTIGSGAARARLVLPILEMARELGVSVIVEGVETEVQAKFFRDNSVGQMQGWLFGRPIDAIDLIAEMAALQPCNQRNSSKSVPGNSTEVFETSFT